MEHRAYPSSNVEDFDEDKIKPPAVKAPWRLYEKRGHCHLLLLTPGQAPIFVCGGDWPLGMISLLCLGVLGVYFQMVMCAHVSFALQIVGYVALGVQGIVLVFAMTLNPGLMPTSLRLNSIESDREHLPCSWCGAEGGADIKHCPRCDVCIRHLDHHNFLLGTCVGAGNHWCLYAVYIAFLLLFLYLVLWGVYYQPIVS